MRLQQHTAYITFGQGESRFSFLPTGDIFEFTDRDFLINDFQGCAKEGSLNNIWLRLYGENGVRFYPMLGIRSGSSLFCGERTLVYAGKAEGVAYRVTFYAAGEGLWLWNVELDGDGETADVVYGQDIGVALKGSVLSNELYTAQYLDHKILQGNCGYLVCSRQNQPQNGDFPYLQQGLLGARAVGFSTDGLQFFGLSYKATQRPEALRGDLPNEKLQAELSYTALQSEKFLLRGKRSLAFYGLFRRTHRDAVTEIEFSQEARAAYAAFRALRETPAPYPALRLREIFGAPYVSPQWTEREVGRFFPRRRLEEREKGELLSFFTPAHTHVVMQPKELLTERPHGHIVSNRPNMGRIDSNIMTSTNYMYGLFNGQTVVGNTSFHKLFSTPRGLLDNLKNSGQRLYLLLNGEYRMLALPAAYEMGMNFARWYYALPGDVLTVASFAAAENPDIVLEVRSLSGKPYRFLLTHELVLGENEFSLPARLETFGNGTILRLSPDPESWAGSPYPALHYDIQFPGTEFSWSDDRIFFPDGKPRDGELLTVFLRECAAFRCVIQGRLEENAPAPAPDYRFERERGKFQTFYRGLARGFHLEIAGAEHADAEKLNEIVWWYSHNAMIHFAAPHGLEQTGGAAWGTRDVCQGPVEYFLTMRHTRLARAVLLNVFAHQSRQTADWPQWFMFDRYTQRAGECHGDIVFWPLKALGDYLAETGDTAILRRTVPYADGAGCGEPLLEHVKRAAGTVEKRFLSGTALISYGGGDWDDTLQPADDAMRENMVSAWTQALAYQTLRLLGEALRDADAAYAAYLDSLARKVKDSFSRFLVKDGVIAGFLYRKKEGAFDMLLHPRDAVTGIHYRLLPMTRSIIAELADAGQAARNVRLIGSRLAFPDGVRTMDCPARYEGGISRLFVRAEQAANVGREISLLYTHAHIRYLEAMAKFGDGGRAWNGLFQANPILLRDAVPNAALRQSNVYFSSSDGRFPDRYAFGRDFAGLRDGSVEVKGGWRLYSSGPGIYLRQLVANILGIRFLRDALVIDPVLPPALDGLRFAFRCFGKSTVFVYHIRESRTGKCEVSRNGAPLRGDPLPNPYRAGGVSIPKADFLRESGEIHISLL